MKLIITLRVQYPDRLKTEENKYNTARFEDRYEQTVEIDSEDTAKELTISVIKAFNKL